MTLDLSEVSCGVELPGISSLAAVLLMRDGSWQYDQSLCRDDRRRAERWVRDIGPVWLAAHRSELIKGGLLDGGGA